jgi:hypothetical protein
MLQELQDHNITATQYANTFAGEGKLTQAEREEKHLKNIAAANLTTTHRRLQFGEMLCSVVDGFCEFSDLSDVVHIGELLWDGADAISGGSAYFVGVAQCRATSMLCDNRRALHCSGEGSGH